MIGKWPVILENDDDDADADNDDDDNDDNNNNNNNEISTNGRPTQNLPVFFFKNMIY